MSVQMMVEQPPQRQLARKVAAADNRQTSLEPLFFILRADGKVTFASPALRDYCGMSDASSEALSVRRFIKRCDYVRLARQLHVGAFVDLDTRAHIRGSDGRIDEFRICAELLRTPEEADYWIGFCLPSTPPMAQSADHPITDLSLRSVMSGNDCVELMSLDESVWAMSMNGAQMPETTLGAAGRWSDFWNEHDRPAALLALDAARNGRVGRFEGSVATGNATVSWWDVVVTPILGADGRPESLLAISRDVTHTKRLEAKLRFLAESGKVLGSSLLIGDTLAEIARLAVPQLVSWCIISWQGRARRSSIAFAGANRRLQNALDRLPPAIWRESSVFLPSVSADALTSLARDDEHFTRLQTLETRSLAIVPLVSRGEILGCIGVGTLERTLTGADVELLEELARRIAMAIENARLFEHERRVAKALQDAMLPERLPNVREIVLSTWYESGKSEADIGGDWYDAFELADGRLVLSVGDVCGSGLRAAVTMGHLRQSIRAIARTVADPALILNYVDAQLKLDAPDALATAAIVVLDPLSHRLSYAIAGHPRPLVRTPQGVVYELAVGGLPLGLRGFDEPPSQDVQLTRGCVLAMFTDGLTEASRDVVAGEAFVRDTFARAEIALGEHTAQALYEAVFDPLAAGHDDVAIITLEVAEQQDWQWHFNFVPGAADMELARISLGRALQAVGAADPHGTQVIFGELLSNVLRYAPGPSEVRLVCLDDRLVLHVLDCGPGFDPGAVDGPVPLGESRRGLLIVEALAQDVAIVRRPEGGMHVSATIARTR